MWFQETQKIKTILTKQYYSETWAITEETYKQMEK
jgi:hypothetical protein